MPLIIGFFLGRLEPAILLYGGPPRAETTGKAAVCQFDTAAQLPSRPPGSPWLQVEHGHDARKEEKP